MSYIEDEGDNSSSCICDDIRIEIIESDNNHGYDTKNGGKGNYKKGKNNK